MLKENEIRAFLDLLMKKPPLGYAKESDNIKKLLIGLVDVPEAFLYVYDKLNEILCNELHQSEQFNQSFCTVISTLADKEFNYYFFKDGFCDLASIDIIRREATVRLQNKQLQEFRKEIDKPKNTESIIEILKISYKKDSKRFDETIILYKDKINKINLIKNKNSRILVNLYYWLDDVLFHGKLKDVIEIIEHLNFDLLKVCVNTNRKLSPHNIQKLMETDFIQDCELLFNKYKDISKNNVFNNIFDQSLFSILIEACDAENEILFKYCWDIMESHLYDLKKNSKCASVVIANYEKKTNEVIDEALQILNVILRDANSRKEVGYVMFDYAKWTDRTEIEEAIIEPLMDKLKRMVLVVKLETNVANKIVQLRNKI